MNDDARRKLAAYQREELALDDAEIDGLLGLSAQHYRDAKEEEETEAAQHAGHSVVHVATPYARCREIFSALAPSASDTFVDLGCGLGRVVLYGASVTEARFVGVELVESRGRIARAAASRAGLDRVSIVIGSALDVDLAIGTLFFLFRPFSPEVEATMIARLHAVARARPIAVGAFRLLPNLFDRALFDEDRRGDLRLYRTRPA